MHTQRVVLLAARLCGLAPYVECRMSSAWRWYSIALLLLVSVENSVVMVINWVHLSLTWYLTVSPPLVGIMSSLLAVLVVRRQHRALPGLLAALERELARPLPVRWLGPLLALTLLAVTLVSFEIARYRLIQDVGIQVLAVLHTVELYAFAVFALGLVSKFADVNDRIVATLLAGDAGAAAAAVLSTEAGRHGGRHELVVALRREHCRISKLMRGMWRCFHVQVTLAYFICGELLVVRTAALLDTSMHHDDWMPVLGTVPRLLAAIAGILAGDRITAEGNRTLDLVHDCLNLGHLSVEEVEELHVFAMYLYQRPIQIKMMGFICIENTLMIKAVGALLSYLLVCLQFN